MGLTQLNFEGKNKVEVAIDRLKELEPPEGYYLAFSGGKDSIVIYDLALESGVKFDAHYNISPIDPPETRQFIRENYPAVIWDNHAKGFWKQFLIQGPPMRHMRWCCRLIKEAGGISRHKIVGTRRQESPRRKGYNFLDASYRHANTYFVRPILDWTLNEVWEYINLHKLHYCCLYDQGFRRLGCILCPFENATDTAKNLKAFPRIALAWRNAFERYYQIRIERGTPLSFKSAEEHWNWWLSHKSKPKVEDYDNAGIRL